MSTIISEGTIFRFEEIAIPSPAWDEYRAQYSAYGLPVPGVFEDDIVRVIYFRRKMMGGYIMSRRHKRYQSYIHPTDRLGLKRFNRVVWDSRVCGLKPVISINCLWRRQKSGILGRMATMVLYLGIGNHARLKDLMILVGASNPKIRSLCRIWNPAMSFPCKNQDDTHFEMFVYRPDSALAAFWNVSKGIFRLKWTWPAKVLPSSPSQDPVGPRKTA